MIGLLLFRCHRSFILKIAVVDGATPFLLSSALLRTIGAVIDTSKDVMWCRRFNCSVSLHLTDRGLFLLDMKELLQKAWNHHQMTTTVTSPKAPLSCASMDSSNSMSEIGQKKVISDRGMQFCEVTDTPSFANPEMCHFMDEDNPSANPEVNRISRSDSHSLVKHSSVTGQEVSDKIIQPQRISPTIRVETSCASSSVDFGQKHKGTKICDGLGHRSAVDLLVPEPLRSVVKGVSSEVLSCLPRRRSVSWRPRGTTVVKTACEPPTSSSQSPVAPTFVKPKAKTKGYPVTKEAHPELPVPDSEEEEFDMVDPSMTMYATQQLDVAVLQERMLHMEERFDPDHAAHPESELSSSEFPDWQLYAGDVDCEFAFGERFGSHSREKKSLSTVDQSIHH